MGQHGSCTLHHVTSRHVTPLHATSHHTTPHHTTPHHTTPHHTTPHYITSHHITPHHTTPHHTTPHHTTPHHTTLHHITPHHTTPHCITSHDMTSHHITSHHTLHYGNRSFCFTLQPAVLERPFYKMLPGLDREIRHFLCLAENGQSTTAASHGNVNRQHKSAVRALLPRCARCARAADLCLFLGPLPVTIATIKRPPGKNKHYPQASGIDW